MSSSLALRQALDELSHLDLTRDIVKSNPAQVGGGGFSDVFQSKMRKGWQPRPNNHIQSVLDMDKIPDSTSSSISLKRFLSPKTSTHITVAVKRLRFWDRPIPKIERTIAKELKIWAKLSHPNVLPILGYVLNWTGSAYPSLVSPWMENGTLRDYMKRPNAGIQIGSMALGIASGLEYLHSQKVVHADLKCDNVLLSPTLQPLLTDFGLSRQVIASISTSTTAFGGSLRWKSPELLSEGGGKADECSDIWSFGMTVFELLTKDIPYSGMIDSQVVRSLIDGVLPSAPSNLEERAIVDQYLWFLCEDCWTMNPSERPAAVKILNMLSQLIPERAITQLLQIIDMFPHLNLTGILDQFNLFILSPRAFTSYLGGRRNVVLPVLLRDLNFAQIWDPKGSNFTKVALLSMPETANPKVIAEELTVLAELSHPNVVPLLGYIFTSDDHFSYVFPMTQINLNQFYSVPENTVEILSMAEGIASGVSYLHSSGFICSTINSLNIMLSPSLQPLIEVTELWQPQSAPNLLELTLQEKFTHYCRWMAVEIFDHRLGMIEYAYKEMDIWALGMTILELFTKDQPYGSSTPQSTVIKRLTYHRLPPPPENLTDHTNEEQRLYKLCQQCWNFEPSERPTAQKLYESIQEIRRKSI